MARATTPQVVRSYLAQLEAALGGVPAVVRDEMIAGIREELDGLDAQTAAARIEELGDPEFIAAEAFAEARAEAASAQPVVAGMPAQIGNGDARWYVTLAALLVAFGGAVVPVVGWFVGIAMVWMSKAWTRADKWIATLAPVLTVVIVTLIAGIVAAITDTAPPEPVNPLIPTGLDIWSGTVLALLANAVAGIWLLWRARHKWEERGETRPMTATSRHPQSPWYPPVTVLLIIGGGYLVPVVGWVVGVAMLWASDRWNARQKWLGTLAGPVAVVAAGGGIALLVLAARLLDVGGLPLDPFLFAIIALLAAPLIANLIVGIRLLRGAN